jgi:DNA-binding NarL/FixJ family response regulator
VLYGRDAERAQIWALLEDARASRSGVLVLRGEAGIGKSALLEDARERAGDMHVLAARGIESESELAFASLHQLLRPALDLAGRLPGPQAAALGGAFGLTKRAGEDRFLISAACLTLLSELAERRPVLCVVDDVQWLDTPSADALLFVARRLEAEGIVLLLAVRDPDGSDFDARGLTELAVAALDKTAAGALVDGRARVSVAPAIRDLLIRESDGNALALVELSAALTPRQLAGDEPLPDALPLTRDIERLFLERVRRLGEPAERLMLLAAADDTGQLSTVLAAGRLLGLGDDALDLVERAGLVTVNGGRLDVRHPLVRSSVYQGASSVERRAAHEALAAVLDDAGAADLRTWHLAAAALGPDPEVAESLERTADRARLRSGHAAAARALERAAELSGDPEAAAGRLIAAASAAWQAGRPERALSLLERAGSPVGDPLLRAQADHVRGEIEFRRGSLAEACEILLAGADGVAGSDGRKALSMLFDAANAGLDMGDYARVAQAAERAAALPREDDPELALLTELLVVVSDLMVGHSPPESQRIIELALRIEDQHDPRWLVWAAVGAGIAGDLDREKALLRRADKLARSAGAFDALTLVLVAIAVDGIVAGRYTVAAEATEGLALAQEAGLRNVVSLHLAVLSWLAAVQGRAEECLATADEAVAQARRTELALANSLAEWALALLDLSAGRPEEAAARLETLSGAPPGVAQPYVVLLASPDLVEACVRSGRSEGARRALAAVERFNRPGAPPWSLALVARCRAQLLEGDDADEAFAEALDLHARNVRPFDLARTELVLGEHLRRRRRRVESRERLRSALQRFEALGAEPWAERARTELRASGETARKRDPSTVSNLTPQELQIVRFVSEGLSNKEVAAQLFLSPRTIDSHLRNVFAKLGITSRTQLARMPLGAGDAGAGRVEVATSA